MSHPLTKSRIFLLVAILESAISLIWIITIPGEKDSAIFFGLSLGRLLLAAIPISIILLGSFGMYLGFGNLNSRLKITGIIRKYSKINILPLLLIWISFTSLSLIFLGSTVLGFSAAIMDRLKPVLLLLILIPAQFMLFFLSFQEMKPKRNELFNKRNLLIFFGILSIMIWTGVRVGLNHALTSPYASGTGIPLLTRQIVVSIYIAVTYQCFEVVFRRFPFLRRIYPVIAAVLLIIFTVRLWMGVPIPETHFTHSSNMGDGEFILHSDSLTYDINSQKMILGYGLAAGQPLPRPFYSFFLGMLHFIFGSDVSTAINAQTVILALIPAIIFIIGSKLFIPSAGLLAAFLFIFREYNQSMLSDIYTLSSARMIMTELPTAFLIAGLILMAINWLKIPSNRTYSTFTGVLLGITALFRTQVLVFFPVLVIFGLIRLNSPRKPWFQSVFWLSTGLLLVILPWVGRNAVRSGTITFEDPAYSKRTLVVHNEQGDTDGILYSAIQNPSDFFIQTLSYFSNNAISSLNQLPWRVDVNEDLNSFIYEKPEPPLHPNFNPQTGHFFIILIHFGLILFGLAAAWHHTKWGGVLPAGVYLSYAFSSSLARYSGWRFIQPVDWILLLYWAIGITSIVLYLGQALGLSLYMKSNERQNIPTHSWRIEKVLTLALLCGLVLPVGEALFSKQNFPLDRFEMKEKISKYTAPTEIQNLANEPSTEIIQGTLLYPIFLYDDRSFNRLAITTPSILSERPLVRFLVVMESSTTVFLPVYHMPKPIPHAVPVIVVGCVRDGTFFANGVLIETSNPYWVISDRYSPGKCEYF